MRRGFLVLPMKQCGIKPNQHTLLFPKHVYLYMEVGQNDKSSN